jgi:diketogulonate reductase-like aldo/keto reductase
MSNAMLGAGAKPSADPYLPQQDIADFCEEKGILIEAYSPLGSTGSPLFQEEGVKEVAKKHNVGAGTVLLSYQGTSSQEDSYMPFSANDAQ